jgi:hypothetical protein
LTGLLVAGIEGQNEGQISHTFLRVIGHASPFKQRLFACRIYLQYSSEIAPGAGLLSTLRGIPPALHQCRNLLIGGNPRSVVSRQCSFPF